MKELTPLLEELAKKLGTTVEQLWWVLLNQVQVLVQICEIWQNVALFLFGGVALFCCVLGVIGLIRRWDEMGIFLSFLGTAFWGIIGGCIYASNYAQLITLKLNPEYWALKEILRHL